MELNEDLREIGEFCFSGTQVKALRLPKNITKKPEELGVGCDCKEIFVMPFWLRRINEDYCNAGKAEMIVLSRNFSTLTANVFCNY